MPTTARQDPVSTVRALTDDQLLIQTSRLADLDRQLQGFVIDHLLEIESRRAYVSRGYGSLFEYVTRGLDYSAGAAWRRINAMKLCRRMEGTRERLRDGKLTLDSAAQLQAAFERHDRQRASAARSAGTGTGVGTGTVAGASANGPPPAVPAPTLDESAREALVEQAVGKSTREVQELIAGVDPALAPPADRVRPLGAERWELKAVIDAECQQGLERLQGLLAHVDPRMTLGDLLGRLVQEGLARHDPGRPPRGRRRTSAPKSTVTPDGASPPQAEAATADPAPASAQGEPDAAVRPPVEPAASKTSPTVDRRAIPAPKPGARARPATPAAVKRAVWQRDGGRCSYVDRRTGRRCASRHLLQIDHVLPYALGGGAEPDNLRLLCYSHHRHRHAPPASPAGDRPRPVDTIGEHTCSTEQPAYVTDQPYGSYSDDTAAVRLAQDLTCPR